MKKTIKLISLAIVAMMLISLVACNRLNETVDDAADNENIVLNEAINKTESEEELQKHTEGVEAAKNMLVTNSNGIVEESNANPTYNFLKNGMGINTQDSGLAQVENNYCYAGNYTQSGTKNVVCFFTSVA